MKINFLIVEQLVIHPLLTHLKETQGVLYILLQEMVIHMMQLVVEEQPQLEDRVVMDLQELEVLEHQMQLQEQTLHTLEVVVELELDHQQALIMEMVEQVVEVMEQLMLQPQHKQELQTLVVAVEVVIKLVELQVVQVLVGMVVQE
jgi:hypothetical protein